MLKLKRVEIHGFKSFFDKTEMRFHGAGIAAVVGPNGCGKSNLSDAMSWVLGEQSAKTLRGARMEDVIFAGTRDRKPLGMASVTMTLLDVTGSSPLPGVHLNGDAHPAESGETNGNGHLPHMPTNGHGPKEVTVTRRLFRDGESEYLINGRAARLRDIQDLFLGTGLGPESYAIIEQGRIGQILSNRPQDRRAVVEEAAGITRFKTKKRLSEAKLEGAKQNLSRVFDILEEVGRQANSLKRQASKAKRYEELKTEMVQHLRRALTGKFRVLEREAAKTALDLNQAQAGVHALNAEVAGKESENAALRDQCYAVEKELTEARARLAELRIEDERTRGRLDHQAKQIGTIDTRLAQDETESAQVEERGERQQAELASFIESVAGLEREAESGRERLAVKGAERDRIQQTAQERGRNLEAGRQQVLRLLGEASNLRNQLAKLDEYLVAIDRDTLRSRQEETGAAAEMDRVNRCKAELSDQVAARQLELASVAEAKRSIEERLSARKSEAGETRKRLDTLRTESSQTSARKISLEEVLSHRTYTTDSVKRLFTAIDRGKVDGFRPAGVLADFVEVDSSYERAVEEFLHEELEYVVVNDWDEAGKGIELMRGDLDGRATFLVHPEADASVSSPASSTEILARSGVLGRLSERIRFSNGLSQAPAGLLPRLGNCFLIEDRAAARRLAVEFPDCHFLLPDGVSYQGHAVSGGKKTGSGPLQLKRELRDLTREAAEKSQRVIEAAQALETLEGEIAALAERLDAARAAQQTQEKEALALGHESRKLAEEFSRAQQLLSVARLELDRLGKEAERSRSQREQSLRAAEEKDAARRQQEQALDRARAELEGLQAEATRLGEEHSALRAEMAGLEERRRSVRAEQGRREQQLRELAARRQELASEMERLGVERARLLANNLDLDTRAVELAAAIETLAADAARLAAEETRSRETLAALDETLKRLRLDAQAAQENRGQIELSLVRLQSELKFLDETSRKELNAPLDELAAGEETVLDDAALEEAESKYRDLRNRIEALGPVNAQALEEFQEAQQRYDFLNAQRQDLLDSIRDTEMAIREIDVETRKRFSEAYEAINANFREMFQTLFGGGAAEMRLTDDTNAAESGIDIVASPPGKKLQNVLLLSGGEKSLTAMALLMAIFRYQPSPFCILDEVDAPLDEANIERLTRLLKEMSDQTQFVVITHAKRTMEAAQSLYGVTMQEPGVSKLVSVKFQPVAAPPPVSLDTAAFAAARN